MATFWTSDLHMNHANVIIYDKRPWTTIAEMNEGLKTEWNQRVKPHDEVIIIGDLALSNPPLDIIAALNGRKKLIPGNHDKHNLKKGLYEGLVEVLPPLYEMKYEGQYIVCCHYAMRVWNHSHHGSWQLYGHSHGSLPPVGKQLDMWVGNWGWGPASFSEIKARMDLQAVSVVDHHGAG